MSEVEFSGMPTLAHVAASFDPQGGVAEVANVLSRKLPEMKDIPWYEGNLPTGHQLSQAYSLPSGTWRAFNQGVARTTSVEAQFVESCGMLESMSEVDVALAALNGNAVAFRKMKDKQKMEGLAQQFATSLWYESVSSNPERFHGLAPRYPATSGYTASSYVLVGTNAGTNSQSIWLATWEQGRLYGIYPKASQAGLQVKDRGEQRVLDASSNPYFAHSTQFVWNCGIAVEDYRYAVRMQWDPDDAAFASDDRGMSDLMLNGMTAIYEKTANTRFYMNRTSYLKLNQQLKNNNTSYLQYIQLGGELIPHFLGIPIRVTDSLVAETAIS